MESSKSKKRLLGESLDGGAGSERIYRFQVLLPNGMATNIKLQNPGEGMRVPEFIDMIRRRLGKRSDAVESLEKICWSDDMYLENMGSHKFKHFREFQPNKCHILLLYDGNGNSATTFQNMWDLTPQTDLLAELPSEYTFETALADLIDGLDKWYWKEETD